MPIASKPSFLPGWGVIILRVILVVALPLALVLINARALMGNAYLHWEYNRPGFSPDPFGFSTQDRLTYAPLAMTYLFNRSGAEFLANEKKADGSPLYNERELSHMDDVKRVTQGLICFGLGLIGVYVLSLIALVVPAGTRPALYRSLLWGSIWTVVLIVLGLVVTLTSFEWLFTEFHRLFFTGNTWIFPTSDTLIRLFPEQFWIDAFSLMFGGALFEAIILGAVMWALGRRQKAA
jgi:integral membrane protein (TIGR01906 family)